MDTSEEILYFGTVAKKTTKCQKCMDCGGIDVASKNHRNTKLEEDHVK